MTTVAEQRLRDRRWRLRHSIWAFVPLVTLGVASWAAFLYIGLRARRRAWLLAAAGYAVGVIIMMVFPAASVAFLMVWLGGFAHALAVRPEWLRWLARQRDWYETPDSVGPLAPSPGYSPPPQPYKPGPVPAWQGGASPMPPARSPGPDSGGVRSSGFQQLAGEFFAPTGNAAPSAAGNTAAAGHPPQPTVDVNTADAAAFARVPGFDPALAARAVEERTRRGRFMNLDEFSMAVGLQPHQLARARPHLFVVSPPPMPPAPPAGGRLLDL